MNLGASAGYFVIDNLAVTASFGFSQEGDADAETSFGIGGRYYFGSIFAGVGYVIPGEDLSALNIGAGYSKKILIL